MTVKEKICLYCTEAMTEVVEGEKTTKGTCTVSPKELNTGSGP